MSLPDQTLHSIKANANLVVEKLGPQSGVNFGLNELSIEWVEGFIERQRIQNPDGGSLVSVLGSFLGEAIIAAAGGIWDQHGNFIGIKFSGDNWAFPFAKVAKQFANGVEGGDSILSFYRVTVAHLSKSELG